MRMQPSVQVIAPYSVEAHRQSIRTLYQGAPDLTVLSLSQRIDYFSEVLLGRPYCMGAAGEGPEGEFDQSPLYRLDCFDCVTYVNTVLALSFSYDLDSFEHNLVRFAYRNHTVCYENRHHFMSVDWNPENIALGWLRDHTGSICDQQGAQLVEYAEALIDRPRWFQYRRYADLKRIQPIPPKESKALLKRLQALSNKVQAEKNRMPYLPLHRLFDKNQKPIPFLFEQIPASAIVEIVRPNWALRDKIGTNLSVSHVGFAIQKRGKWQYRQASSIQKKVVDVPLIDYLAERVDSNSIRGIHVLSSVLS